MNVSPDRACVCVRGKSSGRCYYGFRACLYCGNLLPRDRRTVEAERRRLERVEFDTGRVEPNWYRKRQRELGE